MKTKASWYSYGLILLPFLFLCFFFWPHLFSHKSPYYFDFFFYVYPHFQAASQMIESGNLPFWNPFIKGGVPFWADPAIALIYPFHFFFLLFSFPLATKFFLFFHYAIAFGGAYFCGRQYGLGQRSSLFLATTFCFSGYMVGIFNIFTKFRGLVWIPLVFGLFQKGKNSKKTSAYILAAFAFAMVILSGHLYGAYFCLLFLALERGVEVWKKAAPLPGGKELFFLFLSLGFSAPLWIPTWYFLKDSERRFGLSSYDREKWHTSPKRFLEFGFYGVSQKDSPQKEWILGKPKTHWIHSIYIGIFAFLLAFWGGLRRSTPLFFKILVFLSFLLALGNHTLFWSLAKELPLFNKFRYPEKFLFWTTFGMAMLSAYGFENLLLWLKKKKNLRKLWIFLLLIHFGDLYFHNSQEIPLVDTSVYFSIPATLAPLQDKIPLSVSVYPYGGDSLLESLKKKKNEEKEVQTRENPSALAPSQEEEYWIQEDIEERKKRWIGNTTMIYGKENPIGYSAATLWRYNQIFQALHRKPWEFFDFFGIQFLLTHFPPPPWIEKRYTLFQRFPKDNLALFKRVSPLPFCQLYSQYILVSSPKEGLQKLKTINWRKTLMVEAPSETTQKRLDLPPPSSLSLVPEHLQWKRKNNHLIEIKVHLSKPSFLLVRTSFVKGWKGKIGNQELPIYGGNHLFMAIPLKKGSYLLRLEYFPPGFFLSWIVWLLTWFILAIYGIRKKGIKFLPLLSQGQAPG